MPAKIYRPTSRNLRLLAARLRAGELVAIPTETVYGLAADALDPAACRRIFAAKGRPTTDPLIVHVRSLQQAGELAEFNPAAQRLAAAFWPGPLTLVLPKHAIVPDIVTAGRPSVALRMPAHPLARRLLALAGRPLAAPSANPFGYISPTTAEHVAGGLGGRIRHILDGGPCRIGVESTIVDLRDPKRPRLLRPGGVSREQIERVLEGKLAAGPQRTRSPTRLKGKHGTGSAIYSRLETRAMGQVAPGQLPRHYSPRTPVVLHSKLSSSAINRSRSDEAWLLIRRCAGTTGKNVFYLDAAGRLPAVARRLFASLRRLDSGEWRVIHAELARGGGLADAINDRLRRAAAL